MSELSETVVRGCGIEGPTRAEGGHKALDILRVVEAQAQRGHKQHRVAQRADQARRAEGPLLNQLGQALIPVKRASPTLTFTDINRVSELLSVPTKDARCV